jgi:hypothetical protein
MYEKELNLEEIERQFENETQLEYLDESQAVYEGKYEALTAKELVDREEASHRTIRKLPPYLVRPHQEFAETERRELANLIETSLDERPIHKFLKHHPYVLTRKIMPAHKGQICISKPRLGCQYEPDFLIAGLDSGGWWWYGVELENPNKAMFTKDGHESRKLRDAIKQIEDWRTWLKENIEYARDALGYEYIDGDMPCYVIVGRRRNEVLEERELKSRRRAVARRDKSGLFLHHFEWLLDDKPILVRFKSSFV